MRNFIHAATLAAVVLLAACGGGGGGSDEPEECSVAIWGDSIGVGVADSIRAARPKYRIEDYTISGTSAEGRLPAVLAWGVTTRISIFQWGMNDLPRSTPELYGARVEQLISHVHQRGGVAIYTGISGTSGYHDSERLAFNAAARTVIGRHQVMHAGWQDVPYSSADLPDGVHPVPEYKARLVARLVEKLDAVATECR